MEAARAEGVELVGPGGLLTGLTMTVLETALDAEMTEHLGYDRHDPGGREYPNSRNGTRTKTVLTEIGPVEIEVPRDRDASFDPVIVRKRQRRLDGVDEIVLSLTARGLTSGEVAAHFDEVYGAKVSKDTIPRITDKVLDEMSEWAQRPLDARFAEFTATWGGQYPAITALWRIAWPEFVPFLDYDVEIRKVICSTNAIESLNARYRRAVGPWPLAERTGSDQVPLPRHPLDRPDREGRARWAMRWKPALNAFAITFAGRIVPSNGS